MKRALAVAPACLAGAIAAAQVPAPAEVEESLRTAPIERTTDLPVGVTKSSGVFFAPGALAASATAMVPPTVERRVGSDLASVQLWVEGRRVIKDVDQSACPKPTEWASTTRAPSPMTRVDRAFFERLKALHEAAIVKQMRPHVHGVVGRQVEAAPIWWTG